MRGQLDNSCGSFADDMCDFIVFELDFLHFWSNFLAVMFTEPEADGLSGPPLRAARPRTALSLRFGFYNVEKFIRVVSGRRA